ncbi:MarR family winged helix-turn-helix transcriptional regulator [Saccharopolyspora shandongensis]|uniref:MarR family winged helix-turn-helix transcriptional regulator n=1 Tax=Saccharopolyspora shandongensis TaxID=418495 RepID=UPI003433A5A7
MIARIERRGLVQRSDEPHDARACRIRLTTTGIEVQRRVGRVHARQVTAAMTRALSSAQLETLRDIADVLTTASQHAYTEHQSSAKEA